MTMPIVTDEDLVALIDHRMTPAREEAVRSAIAADVDVARRHAFLASSTLPFADAFRPMLDATPPDLIRTIEQQIAAQAAKARPETAQIGRDSDRASPRTGWLTGLTARMDQWMSATIGRAGFIPGTALGAAAALLVVLGVSTMAPQLVRTGGGDLFQMADASAAFIENVAAYQSFYTKDTIAAAPLSPQQALESLSFANERLGRSFAVTDSNLSGFEFRRAQILSFEGRPVGQFVMAATDGEPLALCVMATDLADSAVTQETRHGLTITSWRRQGFIYVTAGRFDGESMLKFARAIERI